VLKVDRVALEVPSLDVGDALILGVCYDGCGIQAVLSAHEIQSRTQEGPAIRHLQTKVSPKSAVDSKDSNSP